MDGWEGRDGTDGNFQYPDVLLDDGAANGAGPAIVVR